MHCRNLLGMKQKWFTEEFEKEAVRLHRTSGRTRPKIAEDLGICLWTLTRLLEIGVSRPHRLRVDLEKRLELENNHFEEHEKATLIE